MLRRLREYVAEGGKIASFGTDSFRRTVELDGELARNPSRRRRIDAFGERTALIETSLAPLSVFEDELGLFEGLSDLVGEFTEFEVSRGLAKQTEALTTAGRDPGEPAFMAFRLGDGWMLRTGHRAVDRSARGGGAERRDPASDEAHLAAPRKLTVAVGPSAILTRRCFADTVVC